MKKILAVLAVVAMVWGLAWWVGVAREADAQNGSGQFSRAVGVFDSTKYNQWGAFILSGNTATGAQTITVCPAIVALPDGRVIQPMAPANGVFVPLTIDAQSSAVVETVTPTAYSLIGPQSGTGNVPCAAITATFANLHSASYATTQVLSGDQGVQEAINDASNTGGGIVYWQADAGNVTLNNSGATTTTGVSVPATFLAMGGSAYVKTTITTAASYSLGTSTTATAFLSSCTSLTAGLNCSQFVTGPGKVSGGTGLTPLVITANATAGAGAVHVRAWGYTMAQSSF
ncbi:MAG: hypothetical protein WAM58_00515 [Candidatus Acidiferrum sp.]